MASGKKEGFRVEIGNEIGQAREALRQAGSYGQAAGWPRAIQHEIELILEEWLVNVISHGFGPGEAGRIRVELVPSGGVLRAEVADTGRAFNPLEAAPPDLSLPPEERPIGGLGIFMIKKLTDGLEYERRGGENVVRFEKSLTEPKPRRE